MKNIQHFTLDQTTPKKTMNLKYGFSGIHIKKIQFHTLASQPINQWIGLLDNLTLNHKSTDTQGTIVSAPILLRGLISANHAQPIVNMNLFLPEGNENNMQSLGNFFNHLEIELINFPAVNVPVTIFYEEMPEIY